MRGVTASHSFFEDGHYVDCIPRERQPSLQSPAARREKADRAAKAVVPPQVRAAGSAARSDAGPRPHPQARPEGCIRPGDVLPSGTVPMRRLTLEEMVRLPTLREFLRAGERDDGSLDGEREDLPEDAATHYYARGAQYVDNYSSNSWLNVWNPTVASHRMSLSQIWVVGGNGGSEDDGRGRLAGLSRQVGLD